MYSDPLAPRSFGGIIASMSTHPPEGKHGPLREIFDGVFLVQGTFRMAPGMTIGRNMVVLRRGDELTLVDPIRLDPGGEEELLRLGKVAHVVRLGHGHSVDVPYSVERFGATYWALPGQPEDVGIAPRELVRGRLPFDGELFVFEHAQPPEGAIRLDVDGGLLVTCDALQDLREGIPLCSLMARASMPLLGFRRELLIGPMWLKKRLEKDGSGLAGDFERLLSLPFEHLVGAHGGVYRAGARAAVRPVVESAFAALR